MRFFVYDSYARAYVHVYGKLQHINGKIRKNIENLILLHSNIFESKIVIVFLPIN